MGALCLVGCATGPDLPTQTESPIFDRARTSADELPAEVEATVDPDTSRYAGEDSAGNKYWAAYEAGSSSECIVYVPADDTTNFTFCGGPGLSAVTDTGRIIEFASSPSKLSSDDAELVGDTLLVKEQG